MPSVLCFQQLPAVHVFVLNFVPSSTYIWNPIYCFGPRQSNWSFHVSCRYWRPRFTMPGMINSCMASIHISYTHQIRPSGCRAGHVTALRLPLNPYSLCFLLSTAWEVIEMPARFVLRVRVHRLKVFYVQGTGIWYQNFCIFLPSSVPSLNTFVRVLLANGIKKECSVKVERVLSLEGTSPHLL